MLTDRLPIRQSRTRCSLDYILVSDSPHYLRVLLTFIMLLFTAVLALWLSVVSAHDRSDFIAYFSAELPQGNKCGPQRPITGEAEAASK